VISALQLAATSQSCGKVALAIGEAGATETEALPCTLADGTPVAPMFRIVNVAAGQIELQATKYAGYRLALVGEVQNMYKQKSRC